MRGRGFNLIELMVTVLVASVLVAAGVPSFRAAIQRHRVTAAVDDLQSAIQYARTEAVLRATYVSLCPSADGATCSGAATYEAGWLVYAHPVATTAPSDGYTATSSSGMLLLRTGPTLRQMSVRGLDGGVVTFGQQGQLEPVVTRTNASQPMAFLVCATSSSTASTGQSTARVPGSRIGVSRYGGIAVTKLAASAPCIF